MFLKHENCQQPLHPRVLFFVPFTPGPPGTKFSVLFLGPRRRTVGTGFAIHTITRCSGCIMVLILLSVSSTPDLLWYQHSFVYNNFQNNRCPHPPSGLRTLSCFQFSSAVSGGFRWVVSLFILAGKINSSAMGLWLHEKLSLICGCVGIWKLQIF